MVNMSLHYGKYELALTTWLCSYLQITRYYALHFHIFIILNVVIIIMTILMSTVQKNQQRMFLVVVAISSLFLAGSIINLITGQYHAATICICSRESPTTTVSPINNKTIANIAFFPQIHNYTSSALAPVNSWIIETRDGVVVVDTQRQFSEGKKVLNEVKKINKPILGVIIYTSSSRSYKWRRSIVKWNCQCTHIRYPINV